MSVPILLAKVRRMRHMIHTLNDQVWAENTHGGNSNTGLCGSVCSAKAGEDDGGSASHRTEERLLCCQLLFEDVVGYISKKRTRRVAGVIVVTWQAAMVLEDVRR